MKGKGQEAACQLFPSIGLTPAVATLCLPFYGGCGGTGRTPEKSKNKIKAQKIKAKKKGQKAVGLFSLENKGPTDLKDHFDKDIGCFPSS